MKPRELDHHPVIGRGYCPKHGYYVLTMEGCPVCRAEKHRKIDPDTAHILKKIRDKQTKRTISE